jgi:hypothetical protein
MLHLKSIILHLPSYTMKQVCEQYYSIKIPVYSISDYKFFLARIHGNMLAPTAKFATGDKSVLSET